jgi:hypothetical protein
MLGRGRFWWGNLMEIKTEDIGIDIRLILRWILTKYGRGA